MRIDAGAENCGSVIYNGCSGEIYVEVLKRRGVRLSGEGAESGKRRGPRLSGEVVEMVRRLLAMGVDTGTVARAAGITTRMARYYRAQVRRDRVKNCFDQCRCGQPAQVVEDRGSIGPLAQIEEG